MVMTMVVAMAMVTAMAMVIVIAWMMMALVAVWGLGRCIYIKDTDLCIKRVPELVRGDGDSISRDLFQRAFFCPYHILLLLGPSLPFPGFCWSKYAIVGNANASYHPPSLNGRNINTSIFFVGLHYHILT
jgi:hypothetical protein